VQCARETHKYTPVNTAKCCMQHTTATHCCNTLLQHPFTTHHSSASSAYFALASGVAVQCAGDTHMYTPKQCMQHTTATHCCNTLLQHTTTTHYSSASSADSIAVQGAAEAVAAGARIHETHGQLDRGWYYIHVNMYMCVYMHVCMYMYMYISICVYI